MLCHWFQFCMITPSLYLFLTYPINSSIALLTELCRHIPVLLSLLKQHSTTIQPSILRPLLSLLLILAIHSPTQLQPYLLTPEVITMLVSLLHSSVQHHACLLMLICGIPYSKEFSHSMKRTFVRSLLSLLSVKQLARVLREGKESAKSEELSYLRIISVDFEQQSILPIPIHQMLLLILQCLVQMLYDLPNDRQALVECHLVIRLQMLFTDLKWLQMDDDEYVSEGYDKYGCGDNSITPTLADVTLDDKIIQVRQGIMKAIAEIFLLCLSSSSSSSIMTGKIDVELSTCQIMEEVRKIIAFDLRIIQSSELLGSSSSNTTKEDYLVELLSSPLLKLVQEVIQHCPLTQHQMMNTKEWILVLTHCCEVIQDTHCSNTYDIENMNSVIQEWLTKGKLFHPFNSPSFL